MWTLGPWARIMRLVSSVPHESVVTCGAMGRRAHTILIAKEMREAKGTPLCRSIVARRSFSNRKRSARDFVLLPQTLSDMGTLGRLESTLARC